MKISTKDAMKEKWKKIKCPYCFKEFAHDDVHFRIAESACTAAEKNNNGAENSVFARFIKKDEVDPQYYEVWGDLRGGTPSDSIIDSFKVPWVDKFNKKNMIVGGDISDKDGIIGGYIYDDDGFVEGIEDKCSHTKSSTRICPYCHNKLPLRYGKNPQKFVSILGIATSGKTVFLKQFLSKINDDSQDGILSHVNGSLVAFTLPEDDESPLELNEPLPDATPTLNFKVPYFITMTFNKDDALQTYDFVIYDVAGEILVNLVREQEDKNKNKNKLQFLVGYIKKSDAIIMLIDPMQLVNKPKPKYPASEMIKTLHSEFGGQVEVPTAVTISKSDLLLSNLLIKKSLNPDGVFFNANSIITRNIDWDFTKKYFYDDEHSQLLSSLTKFYIRKASPFYTSVKQQIKINSFFAVSSLFDGVDQIFTFKLSSKNEWKSEDIGKYIKKFPILKSRLERIQTDLRDQDANPHSSIIIKDNISVSRSFIFDQSDDVARRLDQILSNKTLLNARTQIRDAVEEQFAEDENIELRAADRGRDESLTRPDLIKYISCLNEEMEDYSFNMYIQSYPRFNGDLKSLRIEEPFFWLLSKLDIICSGNLFGDNTSPQSRKKKFALDWVSNVWPFGGKS